MPSYPSLTLSNLEVAYRALSMVGRGTYDLGSGGRNPAATFPFDRENEADCSGFTAWCAGHDRVQGLGTSEETWYDTATILQDAKLESLDLYSLVPRSRSVKIGDLIVYYGPDKGKRYGHIGVVTWIHPDFEWARANGGEWWKLIRITHCTVTSPAVITTDATLWKDVGYFIRCNLVRYA